jgi:methylenetetrahydrofolate dehydrogenase (NADP+)/methenyltetrahydrofolate cyclohydrolase/formyltetrahydrofolate synthetase
MVKKSPSKIKGYLNKSLKCFFFSIRNIREKCRVKIEELQKQQNDFKPGFAVVQVGNREDSNVYIRHKLKAAEEIGIQARLVRLDSSTTERQVCFI